MEQLREFLVPDLPQIPDDANLRIDLRQLPPHIRNYYEQLLDREDGLTDLYRGVGIIVNEFKILLNTNPPVMLRSRWERRKKELACLEAELKIAEITKQESSLYDLCCIIACQKDGYFFNLFYWNTLPIALRNFIWEYKASSNTKPPLLATSDNESINKKHLYLICGYQVLYQKYLELKKELHDDQNLQNMQQRIEHYLHLSAIKEQKIQALKAENEKLIAEQEKSEVATKPLRSYLQSYLQQNSRLRQSLHELNQQLSDIKQLRDENGLLKLKVQYLKEENRALQQAQFSSQGVTSGLSEQVSNAQLQEENNLLKNNLALVSAQLRRKSHEVSLLRTDNGQKEEILRQYMKQIKKFQEAASAYDEGRGDLSNEIGLMLDNIEKDFQQIIEKQPHPTFFGYSRNQRE